VIRADTPRNLCRRSNVFGSFCAARRSVFLREESSQFIQVENYIDGLEIAVEAWPTEAS